MRPPRRPRARRGSLPVLAREGAAAGAADRALQRLQAPRSPARSSSSRAASESSGVTEQRIAQGRDQPVAWSPASSLWGRLLNFEADQPLVPDENPSIVRTPLVIAMWEPMAKALGYPRKPLGFDDILARALRRPAGATTGCRSTAPSSSCTPTRTTRPPACRPSSPSTTRRRARRRACGRRTSRARRARPCGRSSAASSTTATSRRSSPTRCARAGSATPPRWRWRRRRCWTSTPSAADLPKLVAIYPEEGTFFSDSPFIVLDADWVTPELREGALAFQRFLAKEITPEVAARGGFRPADLEAKPVAPITAANGVDPKQPERELGLPEPRVLALLKRTWREDRKPANVLLVLDTSGSMTEESAAGERQAGPRRVPLPGRPAGPRRPDDLLRPDHAARARRPVPREQGASCRRTIERLIAEGGTAFYDATARATPTVRDLADRDDRINAVVLLTDGEDTDSTRDARARSCASSRARTTPRPRCACSRSPTPPARRGAQGAREDRRGLGRQLLPRRPREHRGRVPLDLLVLLAMADLQPYRRREFAGALAANAAAKPFNVAVLVVTMAAAVAVGGAIGLALLVALLVYAAACVRTFFDEEEADRCSRACAPTAASGSPPARRALRLDELAPPIREHVRAARRREATIREAIERSELPYEEVSAEVDGFVRAMERTAARAQTLYEALADNPPEHVEAAAGPGARRAGPRGARRGARAPGARAAPDGGPARPLLRRDGADDRRARHDPRQPRSACRRPRARRRRRGWPATCAPCASAWAPSPTGWRRSTRAASCRPGPAATARAW